jgi:hypothetical protein
MKNLRWAAICSLGLAVTACSSWDKYAAGQSQKYSGSSLFTMYEEWGTPISRTRLPSGGRFYRFRKQATGCEASAWTNDLDIILQFAVSGPSTCSAGK